MAATIPDPTLEALVPRPSTARNVTLLAAAALLLVTLWFAPLLVRPTIVGDGGSWSSHQVDQGVLTVVDLDPQAVGGVVLERIDDVPGATVEGAWVVRADGVPAAAPTGSWAKAVEDLGVGASYDPLPARIADRELGRLVIAWRIEDCGALVDDLEPTAHLTTVLHTPAVQSLAPGAGPAWSGDERDAGPACP